MIDWERRKPYRKILHGPAVFQSTTDLSVCWSIRTHACAWMGDPFRNTRTTKMGMEIHSPFYCYANDRPMASASRHWGELAQKLKTFVFFPPSACFFHQTASGAKEMPRNGEEKEWLLYTKNSARASAAMPRKLFSADQVHSSRFVCSCQEKSLHMRNIVGPLRPSCPARRTAPVRPSAFFRIRQGIADISR